ncbi:MAG: hypothetical protein ABEJ26_04910 [Halosimplex sp.]
MRGRELFVATLVFLAGCGAVPFGGAGPEAVTDTVTPVPITDAGTSATPSAADLPPGVSPDGTVQPERLVAAHRESLSNRTYTWTVEYDTGREGLVSGSFSGRVAVGDDAFLVEQTRAGPQSNTTLYVNETGGYLRSVSGGYIRYDLIRVPGPVEEYDFADEAIRRYLTGISFDVRRVERRGETYTRLHAADGSVPRGLSESDAAIENYTATAYVTPEGFVRSLTVNYDRREGGQRTGVVFRYDYGVLGNTTVTAPEWSGRISPRSTPTPVDPESESEPATPPDATVAPRSNATGTPTPTETETATAADELDEPTATDGANGTERSKLERAGERSGADLEHAVVGR